VAGKREGARERLTREMMQSYNTHGGVVVDGHERRATIAPVAAPAAAAREKEVRRSWIDLPDLQPAEEPSYQPLPPALADAPQSRFAPLSSSHPTSRHPSVSGQADRKAAAPTVAASTVAADAAAGAAAQERVSALRDALGQILTVMACRQLVLPSAQVAYTITKRLSTLGAEAEEGALDASVVLPSIIEQELKEKTQRTMELLRHFYGCFPLHRQQTHQRARRLSEAMESVNKELEQFKEKLKSADTQAMGVSHSSAAANRAAPLQLLLRAGIEKFKAEGAAKQPRLAAMPATTATS